MILLNHSEAIESANLFSTVGAIYVFHLWLNGGNDPHRYDPLIFQLVVNNHLVCTVIITESNVDLGQ